MTKIFGKSLFIFLGVMVLACSIAIGQTTFGSLVGTITDTSGAVVPGVQMTLTNLGTNGKQVTITNSSGIYEFVNVLPGNYRIEAEKSGFKHFSRSPIEVQVRQSIRINVILQVGAVTQTVNVTAATPLLQSQTSSLGQVIAGRAVGEMPLNGRNVFNLMELVPGVIPQGQSIGTPTGTNPFAWGNYQVNGAFGNQSAMYLDGMPMNDGYINLPGFIPTQDSIQEFKMQTNNLGPEWGHFAGGVMNLTTKSGTNQIHGEAYEYLRNAALNANDFFGNQAGIAVPAFTQNQYGGNVGGPLVIPGVYNGKNKTFWFFSYEGFRLRLGQPFVLNVPTAAERGGNFSNLRDSSGNVIPIYNPLTVCGQLGNPACAVGSNGQPIVIRQPFAGNTIPTPMQNPTSLALEHLWPLPNTAGQPFTNLQNWVGNASEGGNNGEYVARVDQNVSDKQHIFGRFSNWTNLNLPISPIPDICQDRCTETFTTNDVVLDDSYAISPTLVTDVHVGFDRLAYTRTPDLTGFNLASVGWPASLNAQIPSSLRGFPVPGVQEAASGLFSSNGGWGATSAIIARDDTWNASGDLTKILGRHTLKAGVQYTVMQHNYAQTNDATGGFTFDRGFTANSPFSPVGGFGFASYLLGYPSSGGNSLPALVAAQQIYRAVYFGDTWQVTKKLTLDLGLRYEQDGPWSERFNRMSLWNLAATNPLATPTGLPLKGVVCLVASSCNPSRNNINLDNLQFAPRLGFAYQLTHNTILRGGYGIFWVPNDVNFGTSPNVDFVNSIGTPFIASINGGITPFNTTQGWSNPFPNGISQPPGRAANVNTLAENAGGISAPVPSDQQGYIQQWNFDIQRQLPKGFFVDMAYAGSKGTNLQGFAQNLNQLPDQYLSMGTALDNQVANPFLGLIQSGPLSTPTVAQSQLLQPYPEYGSVQNEGSGFANSIYQSFQLKVQRRFNSGGTLLVAYTAEKLISDTDTLTSWLEGTTGGVGGVIDWNNIEGSYSLSSQDVPQDMVISYVQNLPVGQGQKYFSGVHGLAGKLISGWGTDGITTFQRGFPLKIGASGGGNMPNRLCNNASMPGSAESRLNEWFNTSCFALSQPFTYGNESRVDPNLRQQGINDFDVALFKNTYLGAGEKYDLQFRTEVFNLFNTPQFGPPGTTVGLSNFGVVSSQVNNPRLIQFALKFMF